MLVFGPFFKGVARIVLLTFYCQALWPTVAFAMDGDVLVMRPLLGQGPLGSGHLGGFAHYDGPYDSRLDHIFWADDSCLSEDFLKQLDAFYPLKPGHLLDPSSDDEESFSDDEAASLDESLPDIDSPGVDDARPDSPVSRALSHVSSVASQLSERSVADTPYGFDGKGFVWSSKGYTYRFSLDGNLTVSLDVAFKATGEMPSSVLSLCNPYGNVILDEALELDELLVQGRYLILNTPEVRIRHVGFTSLEGQEGTVTLPEGRTLHLGSATLNGARFVNKGHVFLDTLSVIHGKQSSFVNEGTLSGSCMVSLETFQNAHVVDMETACFWVQDFMNDGDFEVKDIHGTVGNLTNSGWMKGRGSIECSKAINRGEIDSALDYPEIEEASTGLEITVNETFQQEMDGVLTGSDIVFKGKGHVDLGGRVMLDSGNLGLFNRSIKIKATDGQEIRAQSAHVGNDVDLLYVDKRARLKVKSVSIKGKDGFTFQNKGMVDFDTYTQAKGSFVNGGHFKSRHMDMVGSSLLNQKEGDFKVTGALDVTTEKLQNKGEAAVGTLRGRVRTFDNEKNLRVAGDSVLSIDKLTNTGTLTFKKLTGTLHHLINQHGGIFSVSDTSGLVIRSLTNRGTMTIQDKWSLDSFVNDGQITSPAKAHILAKTFQNKGVLSVQDDLILEVSEKADYTKGRIAGKTVTFRGKGVKSFGKDVKIVGPTKIDVASEGQAQELDGDFESSHIHLKASSLHHKGKLTTSSLTLTVPKVVNSGTFHADHVITTLDTLSNTGTIDCGDVCFDAVITDFLNQGTFHAERVRGKYGTTVYLSRLRNLKGRTTIKSGHVVTYGFEDALKSVTQLPKVSLNQTRTTILGETTLQEWVPTDSNKGADFHVKGKAHIQKGAVDFKNTTISRGALLGLGGEGEKYKQTLGKLTIAEKGVLRTLAGLQGIVTDIVNDGTIESALGLRLGNLVGVTRLGKGKVEGDLIVDVHKSINVAHYLYAHGHDWQCTGTLYLNGDTFCARWDTTYAGGVVLKVRHFQNAGQHLKFRSLKLKADQFENGLSNTQMGYIETCMDAKKPGASTILEIIVKGDLDNRYGKLFGHGETTLHSIDGTVLVGESVDETRWALNQWASGNHISYPYYTANESFVASNANLKFLGRRIFLKLAQIKSRQGHLTLDATETVTSLASDLYGKTGITINGVRFDHEIFGTDHSTSGSRIPHGSQGHLSYTFYKKYQRSQQPLLRSLGDIRFNTTVTRNYGGVILTAKSVIDKKGRKWKSTTSDACPFVHYESQQLPCHWDEHGQGGQTYHGGTDCVPAIVQAGEHVMVEAPYFGSSGYVSGATFTLDAATASFQHMGHHAQAALQTLMDLGIVSIKSVVEPDITKDGLVVRQADGTVREKGDALAYATKFSKSRLPVLGRSHLGVPSGAKMYVTVSCEMEKLLQLMAFTMGRVHDQGLSGEALYDAYIQEGQRQAEAGALMDMKANRSDKPFLVWALEKVQHAKTKEESMLAVMNLFVPEALRYQGRSGETRAHQKVAIQTEDDLVLTGGKLRSDEDVVTATVGGSFVAQAHVETLGGGDVYHQTATPTVLEAPKARVGVTVKKDVDVSGIRVLAKDHIGISGKSYTDRATRLEANTVVHSGKKKSSIHTRTHDVSVYETTGVGSTLDLRAKEGAFYAEAPRVVTGPKGKATLAGHGVVVATVQDEVTVQTTEKGKSGGMFGGTKTVQECSQTSKARGATFNNELEFVDLSGHKGITLVGVDGSQVTRVLFESRDGLVQLLAGLNAYSRTHSEHSKSAVWQSAACTQTASTDYAPCVFGEGCEFDVKATMPVIVEQIRSQTLAWLKPLKANLDKNGGALNIKELDPIYTYTATKQQGPTAALSMMAALAITLATAGSLSHMGSLVATQAGLTTTTAAGAVTLTTAGAVVQGMTAATLTSLCVSAGNSVLNNTHNPTKAFQDFLSDKTWVGALKAGATGGATAGLGHAFGVAGDAATIGDRMIKAAVNTVATTGVQTTFGENLQKAFQAGLMTGTATVVQGTLAHKIGDYKPDTATGLGLHGLAGGLSGAILGGRDGILPGSVAAMVGEGVAEGTRQATFGKFMGAVSGAATDMAQGRDGTKGLAVGTFTATTAVEENYERHKEPSSQVPAPDSEEEPREPEEYVFRPHSPRTAYALEEAEKFEGLNKTSTEVDQERRRQSGLTTESVFKSAYEFKQRELAGAFVRNERAGKLTDYEARVLHDYRTGASISLALEALPLAVPLAVRAIVKLPQGVSKAANSAQRQAFQKAVKGMDRGSVERFRAEHTKSLPAPKMVKHHVFNVFRGESLKTQKYRDFFRHHHIELDNYCIQIPESMHRSTIHAKGRDWTNAWKQFIDSNPLAETKDVYQFAGKLMDEYGVSHVPIVKYR